MRIITVHLLKISLLLATAILVNLHSSSAFASELPQNVRLTTHDLAPYGSYQSDGTFSGVAHDVVSCALANLNVTLELRVLPWRRAQLEVQEGISDGFYAGSQNSKRDEYAVKSIKIADQLWKWYFNAGSSWDSNSLLFKQSAVVSSFLGANMQKWLVDNQYQVTTSPVDTKQLLNMLLLGRIDAALANNYVMDDLINKRGVKDRIKTEILKDKPLYVYFRKTFVNKYQSFLTRFNRSVEACRGK